MFGYQFIRWIANIVGVIGRGTRLSSIPFLQNLYNRLSLLVVPHEDIWVAMDNQVMLLPNPHQHLIGRMIYLQGTWEDVVSRILCKEAHRGMTALDVGAHAGYYTLLMAKRVGPEGRVFSFEPNPIVRRYLEQNVQRNGYSQVTICPFALFSKNGSGILEERDSLNSSIIPQVSPSDNSVKMMVFDQIKKELGIDKVDLIKMDVEGAELDILNGMKDLLDHHHPSLIIEVHPSDLVHFRHSESEIREYIRSFGYTVKDIWSQTYTKTILCKQMESE